MQSHYQLVIILLEYSLCEYNLALHFRCSPQTDLEMVTEDLAQKVNRPYLRTPRHKIIRAACLVQQKRQEFLASVARGVAPNDSPEAPRRRFYHLSIFIILSAL